MDAAILEMLGKSQHPQRPAGGSVQYKVEAMTFYSKPTLKRNHIADASAAEIQTKLEEYASDGWTLTSTDAASFGAAMYIYLYFAKE